MTEESNQPAEADINKIIKEKFETKREEYKLDMIKYKALYDENYNNDYYLFLYLASILNFIESHHEGTLTILGMKSLSLDISYIIKDLNTEGKELDQKDLVRFSLNVLASYATCVLVVGMFSISKENPTAFFELNPFPTGIQDDFEMLQEKALQLIPTLKQILDVYTPKLDAKHRKYFNEEKTKGFVKCIYEETAIKLGSVGMPSNIAQAKCMS